MIEVTAHGVVARPGFVAATADVGGFDLHVRPGRWGRNEDPMSIAVTVQREDCGWLEGIYLPGTSVVVVGSLSGEEQGGKTRIKIHASELLKSDADDEGKTRHQFIRGHLVGRIKRAPQYSGQFCNFDLLSWAEKAMSVFDCKIAGDVDVMNFRRLCSGEGTRVSLSGNFREHRFEDRSGVKRNRMAFDVENWEVLR